MDIDISSPIKQYTEDTPKIDKPVSKHHPHYPGKKQNPLTLLVLLLLVLAIPVTAFVISSRSQITDDRSRAATLYPPTPTSTSQCPGSWIPVAGVGCCPGGSDICSTVGATQCNGNILAECKVFNAACPASNRNYWAGVGSCTIGDPSDCLRGPVGATNCVTGSYVCHGASNFSKDGCQENGVRGTGNEICFSKRTSCGVEQIDMSGCTGWKFKSRMYTDGCPQPPTGQPTPTKLPPISTITPRSTVSVQPTSPPPSGVATPTPTKPVVATATPTGTLTCQKLEAYLGTVNVTNNLGQIKYGDVVTFKGYANQTNTVVKSLSFQMTIDGKAQPIITVAATKEGTVYTAKFQYTFNTVGAHIVRVISINK